MAIKRSREPASWQLTPRSRHIAVLNWAKLHWGYNEHNNQEAIAGNRPSLSFTRTDLQTAGGPPSGGKLALAERSRAVGGTGGRSTATGEPSPDRGLTAPFISTVPTTTSGLVVARGHGATPWHHAINGLSVSRRGAFLENVGGYLTGATIRAVTTAIALAGPCCAAACDIGHELVLVLWRRSHGIRYGRSGVRKRRARDEVRFL
jgi:hypothetical protein